MLETIIKTPPKEYVERPSSKAPFRLKGLDHFVIVVPDLVAAERWYVEVMGATIVARYNWGGDTEHDVLPHLDVKIGDTLLSIFLDNPGPKQPRLVHHAYGCRDMVEWDAWHAHVKALGVPTVGPTGHDGFALVSLHFDDPWGHGLEIVAILDAPEAAYQAIEDRDGTITGRVRVAAN